MSTVVDPPVEQLEANPETRSSQAPAPPSPPPRRRYANLWVLLVPALLVGGTLFLMVTIRPEKTPVPATKVASGMPMMGGSSASVGGMRTVRVELGEMYVKPSMMSVPAGKVKFVARNMGKVEHELMVERMPIKLEAPGKPVEDAALGMIQDMGPMHSGQMAVNLKPGKYELFCNVPGHYAAGQHTTFTVTRS